MITLKEFGDQMLGQAIGKLKLSVEEALSMDINLLALSLFYHNEDLNIINGIYPEQHKAKPTMRHIRKALGG